MKKRTATILVAFLLATSCATGLCACGFGGEGNATISSSTKPSMPNETMQTVEADNVWQELDSFKNTLYQSENGSCQTYSLWNFLQTESGNFSVRDENGENTEEYVMATVNRKNKIERATSYSSKGDSGVTGAYTICSHIEDESAVDKANPGLSYLNKSKNGDYYNTVIQNNSKIFGFFEKKEETEEDGLVETPEKLLLYSDDSNNFKTSHDGAYLLLETAVFNCYGTSQLGINGAFYNIEKSNAYLNSNDKNYIYALTEDMYDNYKDIDIKDFELTVNKSETKLYASAKYTIEFIPQTYVNTSSKRQYTQKIEVEDILFVDLQTPTALNSLSTNGKDLSKITLSTEVANYACPNITSEQLTQAVKEGTTITVDVIGSGDVSKLNISCAGYRDDLAVVDGKITIDCAAIKEYIDGRNYSITDVLYYQYTFDDKVGSTGIFEGHIVINYNGN